MSTEDNILNIPIQINGTLANEPIPEDLNLLDRELFLTNTGDLLYGKEIDGSTTVNHITPQKLGGEGNLAEIDNTLDSPKHRIGAVETHQQGKGKNAIYTSTSNDKHTFNNFKFESSTSNNGKVTSLNKLTLSNTENNTVWGNILPLKAEPYQVFFKINDTVAEDSSEA